MATNGDVIASATTPTWFPRYTCLSRAKETTIDKRPKPILTAEKPPVVKAQAAVETPTKTSFLSRLQRVVSPKAKVSPVQASPVRATPARATPTNVQNLSQERKIDYFDRRLSSAFRSLKLTTAKPKEQPAMAKQKDVIVSQKLSSPNRIADRRISLQPQQVHHIHNIYSTTSTKTEYTRLVNQNGVLPQMRTGWHNGRHIEMNNYIKNLNEPFCEVVQYKQLPTINYNNRLVNIDANANIWY